MPTLDFKGKSFVYTHHLGVPYRELNVVPAKSCPKKGANLDDNLILHGDNLESLKALLPRYAGKIDLIFIDPPYNTGEEGWCYNDRVNSPLMREWLKASGNPVEKEDLQRHDKWLSMMWPRLQLLKELMAEDGCIFISIDDNEVHRLRSILDEIFGENNFISSIVWQKRTSPDARVNLGPAQDYILVYAKSAEAVKPRLNKIELSADRVEDFKNPDKDPRGDWASVDLTGQTGHATKDQFYEITTPSGNIISPPSGRCWALTETTFKGLVADNRIWFGKNGDARPRIKKFLNEAEGSTVWSWWTNEEVGHNQEATKILNEIMGVGDAFPNPKPPRLIQRIIQIATEPEDIILDSFAGSGTTAHAVLAQNKKDGGNRRFILCEMEDYADTLTAERVRRVINGYKFEGTVETELCTPEKVTWTTFEKDSKRETILDRIEGIENLERENYHKIVKKITDGVLTVVGQKQVTEKVDGLGGSFTYVELGESMDLERLIAETPGELPSFASLARYLFYTVTGKTLPEDTLFATGTGKIAKVEEGDEMPVFIGETDSLRLYLNYKAQEEWLRGTPAALTRKQAEHLSQLRDKEAPTKSVLVVAAAKYISHKSLQDLRVEFAQLPYTIHRIAD